MERSDCTASRQVPFANFDAEKYLGCPRLTVEIVNRTMYLAHVIIAFANVLQELVKTNPRMAIITMHDH